MTCKDCVHHEACRMVLLSAYPKVTEAEIIQAENNQNKCVNFKDKTRFVELPCKVGDTVYYVFANKIFEKRVTQYREILRKSEMVNKWYCVNFSKNETFEDEDIGKTVFLTREEAEKALERNRDRNSLSAN